MSEQVFSGPGTQRRLAPNVLTQLQQAGGGQTPVVENGLYYQPGYSRYTQTPGTDPEMQSFIGVGAPTEFTGGVAPGSGTVNVYDPQGAQTGTRNVNLPPLAQDVATWAAMAYGANALGGALTGGMAAAAPAAVAGETSATAMPGAAALSQGAQAAGAAGAATTAGAVPSAVSTVASAASPAAAGASMLDKAISNPKVWQAGLGALGVLANSGGSSPTPPNYTNAALATSNSGRYNEVGPTGSVSWSLRPGADPNNPQPGDYIRTTELSPEQQQLYDQGVGNQLATGKLAGAQIGDLGQGRQAVQDALYRRATQYYDDRYGRQEEALRTRLLNEGLTPGSQAYANAMKEFGQNRDTAYADATDRAIAGASQQENDAVARIANILAMSRGQTPTSGNSAGGAPTDLLKAANDQYTANLGLSNAGKAQNQANINSIIQLIAALNGG